MTILTDIKKERGTLSINDIPNEDVSIYIRILTFKEITSPLDYLKKSVSNIFVYNPQGMFNIERVRFFQSLTLE